MSGEMQNEPWVNWVELGRAGSCSQGRGKGSSPQVVAMPSRRILLPPLLVAVALLGLWVLGPPKPPIPVLPPPPSRPRHPLQPPYPHPYRFLLNQPHKCRGQAPFLVLLVATEPGDTAGRDAVRRTWGHHDSVPGVSILRLFLVGVHPVFGEELGSVLEEESLLHQDIIQQDFLDTYNNLTLKTLMGLEWVAKHCPQATYVVKADTDVFLNLRFLLHRFLLPPKANFSTGYVYRATGPIRSPGAKWFVPREVYPGATYPPYCAGPAYVLSGDLVPRIYAVAQTLPLINMEDSFVGICLQALGVGVTSSPPGLFNTWRLEYDKCRFSRLVMVHHYPPQELLSVWKHFQEANVTCPTP